MKELNCLVTGASSGIGKEISVKLSNFARHIYISSRNIKKLEEVHDQIVKKNCECTIVPLNLCDENGIENLAKQIFQKDKSLDVLILSAGIINQLSPIDSIELEKLKEVLNLNYLSNFRMIKNFHPLLKNSKNSNIALISSEKDIAKGSYWGIYQPIMTALNELFLTYANENKSTNIKTNIFCPKAVNTNFREVFMPGEDKRKISDPKLIANKIINYIIKTKSTGRIIRID
tara:strand:- start:65 stop:757 length:693 start_codon:yes stop_codon:yes gene_type:complete